MKRSLSALAFIGLLGVSFSAQAPERLAQVDRVFQQSVDDNKIAGAVVLVLRGRKAVYERAVGWADKEAGRKMTTDTIFRIASQTKALTSTAILALVEEGQDRDQRAGESISSRPSQDDGRRAARRRGPSSVPASAPITIGTC